MTKAKVLFLCTGNSCRSQMAEGWAKHLKADQIDAYSAGIEPHGMNARAVKVMAEAGVEISGHHSKHVDELATVPFDYVVTVCDHANETCPIFPGKTRHIHVGFDDPPRLAKDAKTEEEALSHYRRVRDEIRHFIERIDTYIPLWQGALSMLAGKPLVLVLCTGNSCRSQMAEAFLRKYQGDKYDVHSAGMDPAKAVHPVAIKVMAEVGIDISHHRPKSTIEYLGRQAVRHIIIVCDKASHSCPRIWPGSYSRTLMPVDDPAEAAGTEEQKLAVFRRVRDELGEAMKAWEPKPEGASR